VIKCSGWGTIMRDPGVKHRDDLLNPHPRSHKSDRPAPQGGRDFSALLWKGGRGNFLGFLFRDKGFEQF
jgi:hypothetical protein